jgi:hypothetical protein
MIALALLVAFGGAITIASISGARRADSAFDDFLDETAAPLDVSVAGDSFDLAAFTGSYRLAAAMAAVPGVEGVTPVSFMGVAAAANGASMEAFAVATLRGAGERPPSGAVPVHGRLADPTVAGEVTINELAADLFHVGVGDDVTLNTYAPDQVADMIGATRAPFRGPQLTGTVVGVVRTAEDVSDNPEPILYLTDAFRHTYGDRVATCDCSFWIRAAPDAVASVTAALPSTFGDYSFVVQPVDPALRSRVTDAVGLEVGALRVAALVAALASALVVAQAIARHLGAERRGSSTLIALGATRSDVVRWWTIALVPVAIAGSVGAAVGAVAMSPMLPRGLARQAVVHPGFRFDALSVLGGAIVVVVMTVALTRLVTYVMVGRHVGRRRARRSGGSIPLVLHARPTVALGANLAVDPGRDRARLAAVSAVSGLAVAIAAVLAVGLIDVSTDQVLHTPRSYAADWDMQLAQQPDDPESLLAATTAEPIDALALSTGLTGTTFRVSGPHGSGLVSPGALSQIVGTMGPFIDRGRPASTAEDVVVGPSLANELDVDVGDLLTVEGGGNDAQRYVVSGIGRLDDGDQTDQEFYVTSEGLARIQPAEQQTIEGAFLRLGDAGASTRQRLAELGWVPAVPPSSVANLGEIGSVPRLLALALCVLGLGGATHSLLVAGRKRRHDLAVATSLGFTRRQLATTMRWQGVLTAGAALLIGLPLGAIAGRVIWKRVADGVGALDLVSIPWTVALLLPLATLLAVGGVAAIIGHRTSMLDPARTLRGE